jgi:hypothetical protein
MAGSSGSKISCDIPCAAESRHHLLGRRTTAQHRTSASLHRPRRAARAPGTAELCRARDAKYSMRRISSTLVMHARFEDGTRRRNACAFPVQRSRQAPNAPSIACIAPVTKPASGPASHATIAATSSGWPWRLIAMNPCNRSFIGPSAGFASVSIGPG